MLTKTTHVFSEIYIHLNWHCKNDDPLIVPDMEPVLWDWIRNYSEKTKGVRHLQVGGTADHLHLLIQVQPFLCLSDWIGKIKGASAHEMNERFAPGALAWQRGYGAVSFARRDLPALERYVLKQKEHHGKNSTNRTLEIHDEYFEDAEGEAR
ncbi:MAG: IS200/IS605 family transposase [Candidatus Sumerlaeia bacterium]|nr:IS200/IS605 family transposase [Candidatus Sumerlaeia bacterium]